MSTLRDILNQSPDTLKRIALNDIFGTRTDFDNELINLITDQCNDQIPTSIDELELDPMNHRIAHILSYVKPTQLIETFGLEVLYWTWIRKPGKEDEMHLDAISDITGISKDTLRVVQDWHMAHKEISINSVVKYAELIKDLPNFILNLELDSLLVKNSKPKFCMDKIKKFGIYFDKPKDGRAAGYANNTIRPKISEKRIDVFLDQPAGIIITYKKIPNLVMGIEPIDDSLVITQIQGLRPYKMIKGTDKPKYIGGSKGLFNLDWKKLCVEICSQIALNFNYKFIGIKRGQDNSWVGRKYMDGSEYFNIEQAKRVYDATATRLGFDLVEDIYVISPHKLVVNPSIYRRIIDFFTKKK